MTTCLVVSLPLLAIPSLRDTVGARASRPLVGLLTSPFVHGFSSVSLVPHLAGNLVLLGYAGSRVERSLGTARFAVLTLSALAGYAAVAATTAIEVNGASVFVWAYAPPLALLHRSRSRAGEAADSDATPMVLAVMWLIVPLSMTAVPYAFGWSRGLLLAFLVGNAYHATATVVGFAGAWVWRGRLGSESVPADR